MATEPADSLDANLADLVEAKLIQVKDDAFYLTDAGREHFARLARECYLDEKPGGVPQNMRESLGMTRL